MTMITVAIIILLTEIRGICQFFVDYTYAKYIILLVSIIPLLLIMVVGKIRLRCLIVRILLGITISMWSVFVAALFGPVNLMYVYISLGVTIGIVIVTIVLAMKLPPLNNKGFSLFLMIMITFILLAITGIICGLFTKHKAVIILQGIFSGLFAVLAMLFFLNMQGIIVKTLSSACSVCFLALITWFLIIWIFTQILLCFPSWRGMDC
nr:unnamed protein product [Trichobilharzia regenti]